MRLFDRFYQLWIYIYSTTYRILNNKNILTNDKYWYILNIEVLVWKKN